MALRNRSQRFWTRRPDKVEDQFGGGMVARDLHRLLISVSNDETIYQGVVFAALGIAHPDQSVVQPPRDHDQL